jgi:hypothetical protein
LVAGLCQSAATRSPMQHMMREMARPSKRHAVQADRSVRQPPQDGWPAVAYERGSSGRAGLGLVFHTFTAPGCLKGRTDSTNRRVVLTIHEALCRTCSQSAPTGRTLRGAAEPGVKNGAFTLTPNVEVSGCRRQSA